MDFSLSPRGQYILLLRLRDTYGSESSAIPHPSVAPSTVWMYVVPRSLEVRFECALGVKSAVAFIAVDNVSGLHVLAPQRSSSGLGRNNKERKRP